MNNLARKILLAALVLLMLYIAAQAQYVDRIFRPCGAGATPYVSVITSVNGNVLITTCAGAQVLVNGVPIGGGGFLNQTANTIFAGPTNGADAAPAFRALVIADIPGVTTLNTLTDSTQTLVTGLAGTDFNIVSAAGVHTFNIPSASATNRGLITNTSQSLTGTKTFSTGINIGSNPEFMITTSLFGLSSIRGFSWSSTTLAGGTKDTGLFRNAAGVLEVNNGTAGTLRDLTTRKIQVTPVAVSALATCNAGAAGTYAAVTDATAPTYLAVVVGGGAVGVPVYCNGANWVTH